MYFSTIQKKISSPNGSHLSFKAKQPGKVKFLDISVVCQNLVLFFIVTLSTPDRLLPYITEELVAWPTSCAWSWPTPKTGACPTMQQPAPGTPSLYYCMLLIFPDVFNKWCNAYSGTLPLIQMFATKNNWSIMNFIAYKCCSINWYDQCISLIMFFLIQCFNWGKKLPSKLFLVWVRRRLRMKKSQSSQMSSKSCSIW